MNTLLAIRRARPEVPEPEASSVEAARARLRATISQTPPRVERSASDAVTDRAQVIDLRPTSDGAVVGSRSRSGRLRMATVAASLAASVAAASVLLPGETTTPADPVVEPPRVEEAPPEPVVRRAAPPAREPFGTFATITELEHNWTGEGGSTAVTRPDAPGPWPVVILFGAGLIPAEETSATTSVAGQERSVAELMASAGLIVSTIDWNVAEGATPEDLASGSLACAVAAANQGAPGDGGDASRIAIVGWGPTAGAVIHASVTAAPVRSGCIQPVGARPELAIAIGDDLDSLPPEATESWARFNRQTPLLFLTSEDETRSPGRPTQLADELLQLGYAVDVDAVRGAGPRIGEVDDPAVRLLLDRIVEAAHAIGR